MIKDDSNVAMASATHGSRNDRERWRGQALQARLRALNAMFIVHRDVDRILRYIQLELPQCGGRGESIGALVIAPPGSGKSTLIDHLARVYPDETSRTLTKRRVVSFKVPKSPNPKAMGRALLKSLGDPAYDSGSAEKKMERITELLVKVETFVVTLDDFQDVPARRKIRGVRDVGDWIRELSEMKNWPGIFLAFGTEEAAIVRDSNPQLLRRMQARLELRPFSLSDAREIARFRALLDLIDDQLPTAKRSGLSSAHMAARIFRATGGTFDYLIKLLGKAIARAVERGSERIEMWDLEQGFADQHQVASEHGNPFSASYAGAILDQPGQIFHVTNPDAKTSPRNP